MLESSLLGKERRLFILRVNKFSFANQSTFATNHGIFAVLLKTPGVAEPKLPLIY